MAYSLETLRTLADLAEQVARLPDEVNVSAETAALLISVDDPPGPRTMEGWRQGRNRRGDTGPPFLTGPGRTSQVLYNVGALRAWLRSREVATTMAASSRRGLTFASVADLSRPEPWVWGSELVLGHALTVSLEDLERALGDDARIVLRIAALADVMTDTVWADPGACRIFHAAYSDVLRGALESADGVLDATDLNEALPAALEQSTSACPACGESHPGRGCRV